MMVPLEQKNVEIGISDGINIEITEGLDEADRIKIWNKTFEESDEDESEDEND